MTDFENIDDTGYKEALSRCVLKKPFVIAPWLTTLGWVGEENNFPLRKTKAVHVIHGKNFPGHPARKLETVSKQRFAQPRRGCGAEKLGIGIIVQWGLPSGMARKSRRGSSWKEHGKEKSMVEVVVLAGRNPGLDASCQRFPPRKKKKGLEEYLTRTWRRLLFDKTCTSKTIVYIS